jgi:hypothetical protein
VTNPDNRQLELRLLKIASWMVAGGTALTGFFFGMRQGASFACGGALAGISVFSLRAVMSAMVLQDRKASKRRVLAGFVLRLLLIPLGLYAMIRFLFLGVAAAVAGFAACHCSIFVEGILEALDSGSGSDARAK